MCGGGGGGRIRGWGIIYTGQGVKYIHKTRQKRGYIRIGQDRGVTCLGGEWPLNRFAPTPPPSPIN